MPRPSSVHVAGKAQAGPAAVVQVLARTLHTACTKPLGTFTPVSLQVLDSRLATCQLPQGTPEAQTSGFIQLLTSQHL